MKKNHTISIQYHSYLSKEELSKKDQLLLNKAVQLSQDAYAPYSAFNVGAAVQLKNGEVVGGSNQENAAYPSGLCAERVTMFAASANFRDVEMECIAIYAGSDTTAQKQISPCGSCRQVMSEYEVKQRKEIRVLLMNAGGEVWEFLSCGDLLPLAFDFTALKKK
ncbi:MAG: cytidine deaminase [Flavobacteriales bacterium]|nr:cytidine deaminase [Flavobacteriales bacterium]